MPISVFYFPTFYLHLHSMKKNRVIDLLKSTETGIETEIKGWVRTKRGNKQVAFIALNDGSTIHNIQLVFDLTKFSDDDLKFITTGSCIHAKGTLVASQGQGQSVEIQASEVKLLGGADETFPLQKKGHTLEFLREIAH